MMSLNDIIYYGEKHFAMKYVCTKQIDEKTVAVFSGNNSNLIKCFLEYFKPYKAQKLYDSHNEDELYGIILE